MSQSLVTLGKLSHSFRVTLFFWHKIGFCVFLSLSHIFRGCRGFGVVQSAKTQGSASCAGERHTDTWRNKTAINYIYNTRTLGTIHIIPVKHVESEKMRYSQNCGCHLLAVTFIRKRDLRCGMKHFSVVSRGCIALNIKLEIH